MREHCAECPVHFRSPQEESSGRTVTRSRLQMFYNPSRNCQVLFLRAITPVTQAFLVALTVKNLLAMQETRVQSLGQENPLEKGMATHSSILA